VEYVKMYSFSAIVADTLNPDLVQEVGFRDTIFLGKTGGANRKRRIGCSDRSLYFVFKTGINRS